MAPPRKFDAETRARAVRMYEDRLRDHGDSKLAARKHVGAVFDINPATLRNWIEGERPHGEADRGASADQVGVEEFRRLQKENAELRRANEILKTASLDPTGQRNSAANLSSGVSKFKVLRGREFRSCAIASSSLCV